MTVLILDGHSRAAIESLQSLGRAGVEVDLAAELPECLAFHSRYAARKLRQPAQNSPIDFCHWLREQDRKRNYELIVAATETSLLGLRALDEDDPLRRKAVLPSNSALDIALDKEKTRALAQGLGVPAPQSRLITAPSEIGEGRQFPLVLKPSRSKVMAGGELRTLAVAIVKNETQRQEQLRQWLPLTPVLEQRYVSGTGIGIEFLFDQGKKIWHFAHQRIHEYPLSGGASSYRRSIAPPAPLLRDAEKLLGMLGWHGVAMVEFKMDARGEYWLMEINPRLWGSLALSIDAGVNFPLGLLQVARGRECAPQPEYKSLYTRDLRTDISWLKANLMADPQDPLLLTRSRAMSFVELLRPLTGRERWDHFDWRDLGITGRTLGLAFADQLRPLLRRTRNWRTRRRWLAHHRAVLARLAQSGGPKKILFVCYGNICRSPLAAGLAGQQLPQVEIQSSGFYDVAGRSSPEKILRIAASFGLDLSQHRSARVSREQLLGADLVIAMGRENVDQIRAECPEAFSHTTLLGLFGSPVAVDIPDPYQADERTTGEICRQIRSGVEGLARCLCSETLACPQKISTAAQSSH
jgi:protein-tyrosine-phosphatase/predicted ATP-grasp superfamily ATP-dependent carboligase